MQTLVIMIFIIAFRISSFMIGDDNEGNQHSLECDKWKKAHLNLVKSLYLEYGNTALVTFKEIQQLNISCGQLNNLDFNISFLGLLPTENHFLLDLNFNIRSLVSSFLFNDNYILVAMHNLKGFNLNDQISDTMIVEHNIDSFMFKNSYFDFYMNATQLITKELCVRSNFEHSPVFNVGESWSFTGFYSKNVCTFVFMKSTFTDISFYEISNSFIYKNQLEFLSINESDHFDLPNLVSLSLFVSYEHITSRLVNTNMFKHLRTIYLIGYFYDIQADLFVDFKRLKVAHIEADNLGVFFSHGIEWMSHLNSDLNQSLSQKTTTKDQKPVKLSARSIYLIFYDNQNYERNHLVKLDYSYPEEDFCLFRDFPHSQLVYPIIDTLHLKACTCTLSWLVKYAEMYQKYDTEMFEYIHDFYRINDTLFCQDILSKCNFSEKLDQCYKNNRIRQRELGFFEEAKLYLTFIQPK